jgi:hypothetical protein
LDRNTDPTLLWLIEQIDESRVAQASVENSRSLVNGVLGSDDLFCEILVDLKRKDRDLAVKVCVHVIRTSSLPSHIIKLVEQVLGESYASQSNGTTTQVEQE